jgi:hypothetical protein
VAIYLPAVQTHHSCSEDDILWEDDGEDKDDSDWLTDSDTIVSDDGESDVK